MSHIEGESDSGALLPESKWELAFTAVKFALDQIRKVRVTKKNAARLACTFLAYQSDFFTLDVSETKDRIERWDQALADAQDGDFRGVKEILAERENIEKVDGIHTDLSRKLGLIVQKLPDFGDSYVLTQVPAWEDPRFKLDAKP